MDIVSPNGDLDNDKIMSAFAICSSYLEQTQESTRNGDKLWNQKKKHSKPGMLKPLRTLESIHDSLHHYELVTMCSFRIKQVGFHTDGIIVQVKDNDQDVLKVTGTGRLSLRNRRFLRKYSHDLPQNLDPSNQKQLQPDRDTIQTIDNEEGHKGVSFTLPTESEKQKDTDSKLGTPTQP